MGLAKKSSLFRLISFKSVDPNSGFIGAVLQLIRGYVQIGFAVAILVLGPFAWILRDGDRVAHTAGWQAIRRMYDCFYWGPITVWLFLAMMVLMRVSRRKKSKTIEHPMATMHRRKVTTDSSPQHVIDWMD